MQSMSKSTQMETGNMAIYGSWKLGLQSYNHKSIPFAKFLKSITLWKKTSSLRFFFILKVASFFDLVISLTEDLH